MECSYLSNDNFIVFSDENCAPDFEKKRVFTGC